MLLQGGEVFEGIDLLLLTTDGRQQRLILNLSDFHRRILDLLGLEPRQLMRTNEAEYAELKLDDASLSREQLITAMAGHPKLIQRPIVLNDGKAALGRPPESVLEIL